MNSWLGSIALAICNPLAFIIGGTLAAFGYSVVRKTETEVDTSDIVNIYRVTARYENDETITCLVGAENHYEAGQTARHTDSRIAGILGIKQIEVNEKTLPIYAKFIIQRSHP